MCVCVVEASAIAVGSVALIECLLLRRGLFRSLTVLSFPPTSPVLRLLWMVIPVYHAAYLTVLVRAMYPWDCLAPALESLDGVAVVAQVQPFAYPLSVVDYQVRVIIRDHFHSD